MEIFDTFYRPDTPSQRYRLVGVSIAPMVAGLLPWITPLRVMAAKWTVSRVAADVWATVVNLAGSRPPYPSPLYIVRALLIVIAVLALLSGIKLQFGVLRGFAPQSRMLRLSQWLLAIECIELVALIWAWPKH